MPREKINQFLNMLKDYLIKEYNLNDISSRKAIEESSFFEVLKQDAEVAMHYSVSYWARDIYDEYQEFALSV